ncbi:MFS general substrate transporter [Purpureocillium lavendulum]|uniref:MFS general substrate transporter n=1 Tax=Purpureocillium lavendulum TaxID=1247861 RepID=A0AB34G0Y8_9HYPO|nr:MFS general substrate transporter [Purpureocillium lavendulum]
MHVVSEPRNFSSLELQAKHYIENMGLFSAAAAGRNLCRLYEPLTHGGNFWRDQYLLAQWAACKMVVVHRGETHHGYTLLRRLGDACWLTKEPVTGYYTTVPPLRINECAYSLSSVTSEYLTIKFLSRRQGNELEMRKHLARECSSPLLSKLRDHFSVRHHLAAVDPAYQDIQFDAIVYPTTDLQPGNVALAPPAKEDIERVLNQPPLEFLVVRKDGLPTPRNLPERVTEPERIGFGDGSIQLLDFEYSFRPEPGAAYGTDSFAVGTPPPPELIGHKKTTTKPFKVDSWHLGQLVTVVDYELEERVSFRIDIGNLQNNAAFAGDNPEVPVQEELKPVDGGRDAWVVLIAGFIFEALFWGFPMCFGVFQNYYSHLPEFKSDITKIPMVGTLAQGLVLLGSPFSAFLAKRFPRYRKLQICVGWPFAILGLLTASFATTVNGLIGTQGFLYGFGFLTLMYPIISMLNEWWVTRKGMAFGLISAASGATGAVMPFIIESLLAKYGHHTTLRASAVAMTILTAPLLPLFKGRVPASGHSSLAPTDWAFLRKPMFWVFACAVLVQGLGFYFPVVFLPSYASSLGLSPLNGAILLAVLSIAQVIGQFALGFLSDKAFSASTLATACCIATTIVSFTAWGLAKSMPPLTIFALIYGFFGFGFGTLRVAMGRAVSSEPSTVFVTFSIFVFLQGVGNVLVGPLSAALMTGATARERFGAGKYDNMIMYVAGEMADASLETVALIESIVRDQVVALLKTANDLASRRGSPVISDNDLIFQFRHDAARIDRLQKVLFCKHIRRFAKEDDEELVPDEDGPDTKAGPGNDADEMSADDVNRRALLAVAAVPWDVHSRYPELPRTTDSLDSTSDAAETNLVELQAADRKTMTMTLQEYETWSEYRHASFTRRRTRRFRQWSGLGLIAEHKSGDDVLDILGFLTGEMVRRLTMLALSFRQRERVGIDAPAQTDRAETQVQGLFYSATDEGKKRPIDTRHIRLAYEATQAVSIGGRSCARGRWSKRGLQLI